MLSSGDTCGLEELSRVIGSEGKDWNTKKPVAPGSSAIVEGRNASIGLGGDENGPISLVTPR